MTTFMKMQKPFSLKKQPGFSFIAITCFVMLYAPIFVLIVYSFNLGDNIAVWVGFSLQWYVSAWHNEAVQDAAIRSLFLALQASA